MTTQQLHRTRLSKMQPRDWLKTPRDWSYLIDEMKYWGRYELAQYHRALHLANGTSTDPILLDVERSFVQRMKEQGLPHRESDALSSAAGVQSVSVDEQPVTQAEVMAYLDHIVLESRAVELVRDSSPDAVIGPPAVIIRGNGILAGEERRILKALNRQLPPGVDLRLISRRSKGGIALTDNIYTLELRYNEYPQTQSTTWESLTQALRSSAAKASPVYKAHRDPIIQFHIIKGGEAGDEERIVTGAVLVPGVVDLTVKNADGSSTGAVGDTYSEDDVRKAMYWWMENSRQFVYHHMVHGGRPLTSTEVVLLENWQTRSAQKIGEQDVPAGTWMKTARVNYEPLWQDIKKGIIKSWSIGARAMATYEEMQLDSLPTPGASVA